MTKKNKYVESAWEFNDQKYPTKRGICDFCSQRDDLKLSFDMIRYICSNDHACMLRWHKQRQESRAL